MSEMNQRSLCTLGELAYEPVEQTGPISDFAYVDISSIDRETKKITEVKVLTLSQAPSRAKQLLRAGDVLVSMTRPNLNAVALVPEQLDGAIGSTGFHVLRSRWLRPEFLLRLVQSQRFVHEMSALVQGALYPAVRPKDISAFTFTFETPAQQTRIVDKLEELLSELDAAVGELKAAQKKLARFRQSLLKAAVEGEDSGQPYPKQTLGDLVTSIGQGWSPKCEREAATADEQWAVMKTTAIQPLAFDGAHNKALPVGLKPRVNLELSPGDLLVTRAGPRNRVGIACLVRKTRPKLILCDKAYRIRCAEERIDSSFLELVLNAPHMVQRIDELKTGISDSGLNLTQDRFFTLEIPLPSIAEQRAIVELINAQIASIQVQEQAIDLSLKQSIAQRQNILRAAFAGELVPQDPNDEPASVLLERIRLERAAQTANKKLRGRKTMEAE